VYGLSALHVMALRPVISSALADRLGIRHPILLAGMAVVSSAPLAAAVSNAGGLGVVGAGFPSPSPAKLRKLLDELREWLHECTLVPMHALTTRVCATTACLHPSSLGQTAR